VLFAEKNGRNLVPLGEQDEDTLRMALEALAEHVHKGRIRQLAVERFDGEPVVGSAMEHVLIDLGFRQGPRKLTLTA
jgi:ATP-dependent Lhr-like helicase